MAVPSSHQTWHAGKWTIEIIELSDFPKKKTTTLHSVRGFSGQPCVIARGYNFNHWDFQFSGDTAL